MQYLLLTREKRFLFSLPTTSRKTSTSMHSDEESAAYI